MDRSDLAIIIPAYNEEHSIGNVVSNVSSYGLVIVVNDASSDGTKLIAEEKGAIVISHETNQGYDGALETGFREAHKRGCTYAVTLDADGQHNTALLAAYIDLLANSADMVVGIRPKPARLGEYLFAKYASLRYGIKDPLCGMKGYHMKIYDDLGHFDSYQSIGTELALFAVRKGYTITQIPIPIADRLGASKFGGFWRGNGKILRALYHDLRQH